MSKVKLNGFAHESLAARLIVAGTALFLADAASAQIGARVTDPPVLRPEAATGAEAAPSDAVEAFPGEQVLNLHIDYVDGTIFNPATGRADKVRLRSYVSPDTPHDGRYVAPAIHTRPGETVRVKLNNRLPATPPPGDAGCTGGDPNESNTPHCFNGTNLHAHGLWVNPSGNGDNVLLSINPGVRFEYEYGIPPEHPAGTFWYHTHRHGSTALQVSSGMAGALIIHGDRVPTATGPGDLDTLLGEAEERVLVFQQIQYYCLKDGNTTYDCQPDDVGRIESYRPLSSSWGGTQRYTSINGLILPDFEAKQGKIERWRLIHGGIRDTIGLQFRRARTNAALVPGRRLATDRMEALIERTCEGEKLPFHLVATDGITMPAARKSDVAIFQPGYRYDALVAFPEAGSYCVIDVASTAASSVGGVPSGSRLLAMVRVAEGTPVPDPDTYLTAQLVAAAERTMPAAVKAAVIADLRNGLRLTRFVPHAPVTDAEVAGRTQELTFAFTAEGPSVGGQGYEPRVYDPGRLDRKLILGTAEEWMLTSKGGGHPFHIHVNPFEIVEIRNPSGDDVSAPGASDGSDPQYPGLKGAWKDTLWVKAGYTLKVRTRYERYIGEFVLHCHILDHEDKGMMQNVAIVLPGGTPASVNAPGGGHNGH